MFYTVVCKTRVNTELIKVGQQKDILNMGFKFYGTNHYGPIISEVFFLIQILNHRFAYPSNFEFWAFWPLFLTEKLWPLFSNLFYFQTENKLLIRIW